MVQHSNEITLMNIVKNNFNCNKQMKKATQLKINNKLGWADGGAYEL